MDIAQIIDDFSKERTCTYFLREHRAALVYFASKLVRDHFVAEDIVTEIYLKFWNKKGAFATRQKAKAFLYISTRNACFNYLHRLRSRAKRKQKFMATGEDAEDCVLNEMVRADVLREIYHLIERLPDQCRRIILMSFVTGLSNSEVAKKLKISVHTVKNQKARGIALMQEGFSKMQGK